MEDPSKTYVESGDQQLDSLKVSELGGDPLNVQNVLNKQGNSLHLYKYCGLTSLEQILLLKKAR